MIGRSVSHYQVTEKLGSGGMGVVWKARDTRLNRIVALKMLPADFHESAERRQRLMYEAQAASALSHPHIVTVFDIVEQDGAEFIVMEYVPGKALDALIPRKGMRLGEALRIAVQVADALSAAHHGGIIHRDLKPGNVMVSESGAVKVLDFGLAKAEERPAGGDDEATRTVAPKTADGVAVGTVGYMSPEQAEAKPVDARTDIFSFGAMLYEMITGERAFRGDTNLSTMAAILHKEPAAVGPDIPAELQRVIARCLRKDPKRRFQHMEDLKVALEELHEESSSGTLAGAPAVVAAPMGSRKWISVLAAAVLLAAGAAWWLTRGAAPKPVIAATEVPLTSYPGVETSPSFSPDGNQVAFSWNGERRDNYDIYVKLIGSPTPLRLTTDPAWDSSPEFSPDGRAIGFVRGGKVHNLLVTIPPIGGSERVVAELPPVDVRFGVVCFSWLPDAKSVVLAGLKVLSIDTGEMRPLTTPPPRTQDSVPSVAPDGHAVAFMRGPGSYGNVYVLDLTPDGRAKGNPRPLTSNSHAVRKIAWLPDSSALVVDSGPVGGAADLWKIGLGAPGEAQVLPFGRGEATSVAIALRGNRMAYSRGVQVANLWRLPLAGAGVAGGATERFLPSTRADFSPAYSPDGKRVVFHSTRSGKPGLWMGDADGSKAAELYVPSQGHAGSPNWSPDGQIVTFDCNETGHWAIYTIRASGGKPNLVAGDGTAPSWSQDSKWIYFASNRSGRSEVWKAPASGGTAIMVTRNGGYLAKESPDGKFLYYTRSPNSAIALWRMPVEGGQESLVAESVVARALDFGRQGIYYLPKPGDDGKFTLNYLPFEGGKPKILLTLLHSPFLGITVSRDERFVIYAESEQSNQELMLVENFR